MLVGLVGKPNVGKSTFFRAATLAQVAVGNYPFVTIKPNHGTAFVKTWCASNHFGVKPTPREGYYLQGWRFVPFDLMDVAGLVPGAHEGLGMGNAFLDDLRQANVLIHVIDCAGGTNEKGEPVNAGTYDPANDIKFLEFELDMWYFQVLEKGFEKFARVIQQTQGNIVISLAKQLSGLGVTEAIIKDTLERKLHLIEKPPLTWSVEEKKELAKTLREVTKPIIIAANRMDVATSKENLAKLKVQFPQYTIIPTSSEAEIILREAAKKEMIEYIPGDKTFTIKAGVTDAQRTALEFVQKNVLDVYGSTGVQQILNAAVLDLLKYMTIYPGGVNKLTDSQGRTLPDCFLLKQGCTALEFAAKLHTDFAKNFIRAIDVKTKKTVGKEHVLHEGDVVEIVANA